MHECYYSHGDTFDSTHLMLKTLWTTQFTIQTWVGKGNTDDASIVVAKTNVLS